MPATEYHDISKAHHEFKAIIDTLKGQGISRDDIHQRVATMFNRQLTKSTITRFYSDPADSRNHNLKLLLRYTDWIKDAFPKELGLTTRELPEIDNEDIRQRLSILYREIKKANRINRALIIRQARGRYRRR